jgi:outer membrane receptor for ferric coprogen and ferric-rhodotorulic acid
MHNHHVASIPVADIKTEVVTLRRSTASANTWAPLEAGNNSHFFAFSAHFDENAKTTIAASRPEKAVDRLLIFVTTCV